jgi:hypothetical protein
MYRHPEVAAQFSAARAAYKTIEPLLAEIARIRELKRSSEADTTISHASTGYVGMSALHAMPIPQLASDQLELQQRLRAVEAQYASNCKDAEIFLRQTFGDAKLPTFYLRFSDGELKPIPAPRWWTMAGAKAFTHGLWESDFGSIHSRAIGRVLVREADLEALLISQSGSSPARTEPTPADQSSCGSRSDGEANNEGSRPTELAVNSKPPPRRPSVGGRPSRADWQPFDQQAVRIIGLDGGNLTRTELRKRMKAFAADKMTDPPDDRTIDRRLDYLVPADLLAED